jgi:hypothetical protein
MTRRDASNAGDTGQERSHGRATPTPRDPAARKRALPHAQKGIVPEHPTRPRRASIIAALTSSTTAVLKRGDSGFTRIQTATHRKGAACTYTPAKSPTSAISQRATPLRTAR